MSNNQNPDIEDDPEEEQDNWEQQCLDEAEALNEACQAYEDQQRDEYWNS